MTKRSTLSLLIASFIMLFASCSKENNNNLPNIVLVFADDLGYGDIGSYGALGYETPNLDKLATQGMRFTNFLSANGACSGSRAGLLTGCYPIRIGIPDVFGAGAVQGISDQEVTIADMLKKKGYATAIFGKWHLGSLEPFLPLQHGFDEYLGIPYSNDMWPVDYDGGPVTENSLRPGKANYPPLPLIRGNNKIKELTSLKDQDSLTTLYTVNAIDFINRHRKQPFFLYIPHSMPHVPLGVSDKFRGKSRQGMFGDVIMEIDWSVGEIIKTLDRLKLTDNTLVIFTSDNGPWMNYGNHAGSTGGLREAKGTSMEGGQREPCIMVWPGIIPEGVVTSQLASSIDIFPTIAEITSSELPGHPIDGVSILDIMEGDRNAEPRKSFLYYYGGGRLDAVRVGDWKLVFPHPHRSYEGVLPGNDGYPGPYSPGQTGYELYDLRRDPGERYNVIEQNPEIVEKLEKVAEEAREDIGDRLTGRTGKNRRPIGKVDK